LFVVKIDKFFWNCQIRLGLEQNLDVSIYAKDCFDWLQMKQIRYDLEKDLDVSIYAKTEYNWKKMKEIRKRLIKEAREKSENGQNT